MISDVWCGLFMSMVFDVQAALPSTCRRLIGWCRARRRRSPRPVESLVERPEIIIYLPGTERKKEVLS